MEPSVELEPTTALLETGLFGRNLKSPQDFNLRSDRRRIAKLVRLGFFLPYSHLPGT